MAINIPTRHFSKALDDFGRAVTWKQATISYDNITGDESISLSAGTAKTWIFHKRTQKYIITKEGVVELGDAYVMLPPADSIAIRDQVVCDGETYEVTTTSSKIIRQAGSTTNIYTYAQLKKVSGDQT